MNVREEAASFPTSSEESYEMLKEFANRSLGGCWWRPWLKPAVLKIHHSANPTATHPQLCNRMLGLLQGGTDTRFLCRWSCYDSHCCVALRDTAPVPCSSLPCCRASCEPCAWIPPCVLTPRCLSTDGPDQENESALCFHLCTKLQPNRMPSSTERHSCLVLCRKSSDKNTIL